MRICFFGDPKAPQLAKVIYSLSRRGHMIHVVSRGPVNVAGATSEVFGVPLPGLLHPYRWHRRNRTYLAGFLRDYDVVSIQFLHSWGFTKEMLRHGCLVVRPWGSDINPPASGPQPLSETIERRKRLLQIAHGVSVTCDSFRTRVAEYAQIAPERISLTPIGVDLDLFTPSRRASERPTIGCYKGFGHAYGVIHLIKALPRIVKACPEVICELVGDGPTVNKCRLAAERLGVADNIRWIGRVPHDSVPQTIGHWWLSVIPSVTESFGIAALESAAMQIPVVASDIGGLPETVIDGATGSLVPVADSRAIADAVIDLINSPDQRMAMGIASRQFVAETYEWGSCIDRWEDFFVEAASRRRQLVASPLQV